MDNSKRNKIEHKVVNMLQEEGLTALESYQLLTLLKDTAFYSLMEYRKQKGDTK